MTLVSRRGGRRTAFAVSALGFFLVTGSPSVAQPADHGVKAWQAERMIKDFVGVFKTQRGIIEPNNKVRVKISQIKRVYNKDVGWIVIAIFEGAVVPDVYDSKQMQPYYHGILKITADRRGVVQPLVVNEGQGLWKMTQRSAILHDELPQNLGGWVNWGGSPADIPPQAKPTDQGPTPPHPPPGMDRKSTPAATLTQEQQKIANAYNAAKKEYDDARKAGTVTTAIWDRYNKAYAEYQTKVLGISK